MSINQFQFVCAVFQIYPVLDKAVRKRLALLINNMEFDCENMRRRGAQRDEENMEKLLRGLGYDVVKHTNLSGQVCQENKLPFICIRPC